MPPKAKAAANLSVPQTLNEHKVTLAKGLSAAEVEARQSQWGRNELDQEEPTPLWKLVLEQFDDQLVQILLRTTCDIGDKPEKVSSWFAG